MREVLQKVSISRTVQEGRLEGRLARFPTEMTSKLAEMGLLGVIFPREYGGAGLVTSSTPS
jgi:alkylation response protein AidB-like acyl-CoA dehydrogenase